MNASVRRLDALLYPTHDDHWDSLAFREIALPHVRGRRVLDYGAGRGALSILSFRGVAERVVGVDPDSAVLGNPHVDEAWILPLPSGAIPSPDREFDVVVSASVLEHVADPAVTFRELFRVLKPGGVAILKTPNRRHYVPLIARLTPLWFHRWWNARRGQEAHDVFPTLYRCNTPRAIRSAAKAAGLEVVEIRLIEGRPEYLRSSPLLYLVGWAWERAVNAWDRLAGLRVVMIAVLRRPGDSDGAIPVTRSR